MFRLTVSTLEIDIAPTLRQVSTQRKYVVPVIEVVYVVLVAPAIVVQGPVAELLDCHWNATPDISEGVVAADNVNELPAHTLETDDIAIDAAPLHAGI